jgi:choline dehydrogenase-like flavoprotein
MIDARAYAGPTEIECDLCIAGAGAAGITLALKLAKPGRRVVLLESGGLEYDGDTQALYMGRATGQPYFNLTSCRLRYFGGTTNHWAGYCNLPSRIDFESRPALGLPGWPVGYDELMPYIARASAHLGIDPLRLDPFVHPDHAPDDLALAVDGKSDVIRTQFNLQSPLESRRFNPRFRNEVASLPDATVLLSANLTHIGMAENGATVRDLTVKTLTGKELLIRPTVVVLACHAIENARLLLASNDVVSAGIGNAGDQVGRNFMDHLRVQASRLVPSPERPLDFYLRDMITPEPGRQVWTLFSFEDGARHRNDMLYYCCSLTAQYEPVLERVRDAGSRVAKSFFEPFDLQMAKDVGTLLRHPASAAENFAARLGFANRVPTYFELLHHIEQAPNPSSRIRLTEERDVLGVPTVLLHWALSEADHRTFARGQELLTTELSALGLARFAPEPVTPALVEQKVVGHYHHMGTTRMSPSPASGVVDSDCRVHGTHNLFVAGSGVFPSATSSGPTMMLTALALRLAEHLDTKIL